MRVVSSQSVPGRGIGMPDYAQAKPTGGVPTGSPFSVQDVGELAARLGSVVRFDRRGYVIFADDFQNGLEQWPQRMAFGNASIEWSSKRHAGSGFSCELTSSAALLQPALIGTAIFPSLLGGRMGLEILMSYQDVGAPALGDFQENSILIRSAVGGADFRMRVNLQTGMISIVTPGTVWVNVAGPVGIDNQMWHQEKLVADGVTGRYERLIFDGVEYNISQYDGDNPGVGVPRLDYQLVFYGGVGGFKNIAYVLGAVGTVSEPPNLAT